MEINNGYEQQMHDSNKNSSSPIQAEFFLLIYSKSSNIGAKDEHWVIYQNEIVNLFCKKQLFWFAVIGRLYSDARYLKSLIQIMLKVLIKLCKFYS